MSDLNHAFPKKPLLISVGLHVSLLLIIIVKPYFSKTLKPYEQVIRVDVVAMPEKGQKIEEPIPLKPKEEKKVKKETANKPKAEDVKKTAPIKKVKEVAIVKDEDDGLSEEDALKALQKLNKKNKPQAAEQKPQEIKGNRASKGTDLIGVEKLEYSNYRGVLHSFISKNWDLPRWLLEGNLSAQASIKIDSSGNIISKQLVKRSGNAIFDQHVLKAIASASPVAPPPDKFKDIVYYEGVLLSFPR